MYFSKLFSAVITIIGENNRKILFDTDVENQKQFLWKLSHPKDLYERSYWQYTCQMRSFSCTMVFLLNLTSLVLLPLFFIKLSYECAATRKDRYSINKRAVFITNGLTIQTIPSCLLNEFIETIPFPNTFNMSLGLQEKLVLKNIFFRYWYSPYFILKCMLKIGLYSDIINKYNPTAIISSSEYSFTSSVLTRYCRLCSIEHINIMHGEKLYNICDAFVAYDRYYVWNQHYVELLSDLRAAEGQFYIAIPDSVRINWTLVENPIYDYTYYLAGETTKELVAIKECLLSKLVPSSRICIRYHPRYGDGKVIKRIFKDFCIENPAEIPLDMSFSTTRYVISLYSTILYQAIESGKPIIINDVTDVTKYEQLKKLRFIVLDKPHIKLSEHLSVERK